MRVHQKHKRADGLPLCQIATGLAIAIGILLGAGTIGGGVIGYIAGKNAGHENLQLFNDVFHGAIAGLIVSGLIALLIGTGGAGAPALAVGGMAGEAVALSAEAQILLAVGAITVTGAIETYLHFANDGRPNGNRRQNKQFDDAFREANCNLNERDSFKLRREVHDYIRRHKKDLNFKKLVELFRENGRPLWKIN